MIVNNCDRHCCCLLLLFAVAAAAAVAAAVAAAAATEQQNFNLPSITIPVELAKATITKLPIDASIHELILILCTKTHKAVLKML